MKHHVLLTVLVLFIATQSLISQATFTIDWADPEVVIGLPSSTSLKRNGTMRNLNEQPKAILFRYNLDNLQPSDDAAFCFGDLCYFHFPGEDDPYERPAQALLGNGTLPVYSLINHQAGAEGTSSVWYQMFDQNNPSDSITFTITYVFSVNSVPEASSLGLTLYPLPATDMITIAGDAAAHVRGANVYSSAGTLLRTYGITNGVLHNFAVSDLPSGSYHMVLTLDDGTIAQAPFTLVR